MPKVRATPLSDGLRKLAARMPRVVREHEILRVAASVFGKDTKEAAEIARREVLTWAQARSGGRFPNEAWEFKDFEHLSGGRNSSGVRIESGQTDIWAIRADDPDKNVPGRSWTTEVVVGYSVGSLPRFSVRLLASTGENDLDIEPHTPGLVQQVAERCALTRRTYKISPEPWLVDSDREAANLVRLLTDAERVLPTFVLSVPEDSPDPHRPLMDASLLARATLGTGHVAILPAEYTWVLTETFGRLRSVFGGAARSYLPGFDYHSNPYSHRLILADHISSGDGAAQAMRWFRALAATESIRRTTLGKDVLAFAGIKNAALAIRQRALKQEGASESEQLSAANARIEALERDVEDQKASLEFFDSEHKQAEERAEAAEEQARASAFRIQQLIEQLKIAGAAPDQSLQLPESWDDFSNWCDVNFAGRLILAPAARRQVTNPEFEDIHLAARCVLWLATVCRDRRMSGGEGSLRDEFVEDGIRNAHCGTDQFDLTWQGQRYTADWHIKNGGNTRDPKRCLRIYYFWHPSAQQIVVAEMPAHRRTGAT